MAKQMAQQKQGTSKHSLKGAFQMFQMSKLRREKAGCAAPSPALLQLGIQIGASSVAVYILLLLFAVVAPRICTECDACDGAFAVQRQPVRLPTAWSPLPVDTTRPLRPL
jgi:hypothetical protein